MFLFLAHYYCDYDAFLTRHISGLAEVVLLGRRGVGVGSVQSGAALHFRSCVVLRL